MPSLAIALRTLAKAFSVTRTPLAGACAGCVFCSVAVVIDLLHSPSAAKAVTSAPQMARLKSCPSPNTCVALLAETKVHRFARDDSRGPLDRKGYFAAAATGLATSFFFFQSRMAARIASSASTEQWIFTGGSESSFTMSMFLMLRASSTVLPLTHSVASEDEAIAEA